MKKLLLALALIVLATPAHADCGAGQPPAGTVCAAPAGTAGVANYRLLGNGHIPSGIDAAKIGGGSVSTTEYNRLDGITGFGQSIIDDADEATFKATVNLETGVDVQAYDADLTTWAGLSPSANAQSLVTAANYAAMRALLDLEAGTDFNAYSARLADIAGITWNQGDILYYNGSNLVDLGPGTSGQFLKTQGAGANPVWDDAPGAGSGVDNFLDLTDTPNAYTGEANNCVLVNATEDGLDFGSCAGGGSGMTDFSLAGDSGTPQTIADGNTLTVAGGTGIDTAAGATDTVTVNLDAATIASLALADSAVQNLGDLSITATATELNFVDGVTSAIQTQIDGKQASDSDLTSWAGITRASGFDTFVATPSSGNLAALVTGETGGGGLVFANSPALTSPGFSTITNTGTITLPTATTTLVGRDTTDTLTNKSIAATQITAGALNIGNNAATVGTVELANGTANTLSASGGVLSIEGVALATTAAATTSAQGLVELATTAEAAAQTDTTRAVTPQGLAFKPESFCVAMSDETTDLTTGTAKATWRMPYAFVVTAVRASVNDAAAGTLITVDINEGGTTILSTKLTIDIAELTSTTAATAAVISDANLADDAAMSADIDGVGTTAKGLKICLIGHQ